MLIVHQELEPLPLSDLEHGVHVQPAGQRQRLGKRASGLDGPLAPRGISGKQAAMHRPGPHGEVALEYLVEVLLLGGEVGHYLVHLGYDGPEQRCGTQEEEEAVDLSTCR